MTGTRKFAITGGVALLAGIAIMIVLHQFGARHFAVDLTGSPWTHPLICGPGDMGWAMTLGPVAMALWFGGILSLLVALRSVAKAP